MMQETIDALWKQGFAGGALVLQSVVVTYAHCWQEDRETGKAHLNEFHMPGCKVVGPGWRARFMDKEDWGPMASSQEGAILALLASELYVVNLKRMVAEGEITKEEAEAEAA